MQHLQKPPGRGVEIMTNQVLGTSQPSFFLLPCSVPPCLCGWSVFRRPYILPSSVCCNPFICHSYENTGGVGVFFPLWDFSRAVKACTNRCAIIGFAASAPAKKARQE